jgi:hypothetical protein
MPRTLLVASLLAAVAIAPLHAQAHPLVGTWELSLPVGATVENGVTTPLMGVGHLQVEAQGDSLVGTLRLEPPAGVAARPPARVAARRAKGPVQFVVQSRAKVSINGDEMERVATSTYTLTARGDALEGTVERSVEGLEMIPAAPGTFTGRRVPATGR